MNCALVESIVGSVHSSVTRSHKGDCATLLMRSDCMHTDHRERLEHVSTRIPQMLGRVLVRQMHQEPVYVRL